MKKRYIPRHVGSFKFAYLDIWGIIFMILPLVFDIVLIVKFAKVNLLLVGILGTLITTIAFLLVAEFPNKRERGIDIFIDFLKYQKFGDRSLEQPFKISKEKGRLKHDKVI